ncbi:MAG: response regulator transcription factor [Solirubrobacteraceae bacterium]|nr:response regulator transcription factor [Patulibacter sp.]
MRRVWICTYGAGVGGPIGALLAELGYESSRLASPKPATIENQRATVPYPDVFVVATGDDGLADAIRLLTSLRERAPDDGDDGWAGVPVLLAITPAALAELDVPTVAGLADEVLSTSAGIAELRVRIALAQARLGLGIADDVVQLDGLQLDLQTYDAQVDGHSIGLTHIEFELLRFLATHPGRTFTRTALLERVWGYDDYGRTRTVDVHVRRLRSKLGDHHADRITTIRSVGYRFER